MLSSGPFRSFLMGGFEASCHVNERHERLDLIRATQHDQQADSDYAGLRSVGIAVAREAARWHLIDRGGDLDFLSLEPIVAAANRHGVQILWSLCHYGWPDDVDLFSGDFLERFAHYAKGAARWLVTRTESPRYYAPFNEISFIAYAIGEIASMYPFAIGRSDDVKRQLVRATIQATDAIRSVDAEAVFLHIDPIYNSVPPIDRPDLKRLADANRGAQFQAFDLLTGRIEPELGGREDLVDHVGVNYYFGNQWEYPSFKPLGWNGVPCDDRWIPLSDLLGWAHRHYQRPMFVAETSHFGAGRAAWLRGVFDEVELAIRRGLPIEGLCLFPIIDRPDYLNPDHWHKSGLWDVVRNGDRLHRVLNVEYAAEVDRVQQRVGTPIAP